MNNSALRNFSRVKKYAQHTIVAGASDHSMVLVLKGGLAVYDNYQKKNERLTGQIGPGDVFGEAEILLGARMRHTAVALTETIALSIRQDEMLQFIREEPEMALELMKALCVKRGMNAESSEESPDAPAEKDVSGAAFSLFPAEHGSYRLPLDTLDRGCLMEKSHSCPFCKKEFKATAVRPSKLSIEGTDADLRHRYRGVEPLYFDVVTCPDCLYSALDELFGEPDNKKADLSYLMDVKQQYLGFTGEAAQTDKIFAGYYLALRCASDCFTPRKLAEAKLLLKLSRVYQDCDACTLELETAKRALDAYMRYYLNEKCDAGQEQQLCLIIGELYLKSGDLKHAREFFFKAKIIRGGAPVFRDHAENRLADIKARVANE